MKLCTIGKKIPECFNFPLGILCLELFVMQKMSVFFHVFYIYESEKILQRELACQKERGQTFGISEHRQKNT